MEEGLKELGLTEVEIKVYLTLLEIGPSQAGIITRKSGIHRRMVYDAVERLIKKGLVGYIVRNNRKIFSAAHPNRLLELAEERKRAIEAFLPELQAKFLAEKEKKETLFFDGKAGLKTVFEDQLQVGKEIKILATTPTGVDLMKFYFIWYDKRREKKKIPVKIVLSDKHKGLLEKTPLLQKRYLPDKYLGNTSINVYGNKVAIIHWEQKKPFAIVINQAEIANSYRKIFEAMWDFAK